LVALPTGRAAGRVIATAGVIQPTTGLGAAEGHPAQIGLLELGPGDVGIDEAGPGQIGGAEVGVDEDGAFEVGPGQIAAFEAFAGQILILIAALGQVLARSGGAVLGRTAARRQRLGAGGLIPLAPLLLSLAFVFVAIVALL
jgi:hypothetical protein